MFPCSARHLYAPPPDVTRHDNNKECCKEEMSECYRVYFIIFICNSYRVYARAYCSDRSTRRGGFGIMAASAIAAEVACRNYKCRLHAACGGKRLWQRKERKAEALGRHC